MLKLLLAGLCSGLIISARAQDIPKPVITDTTAQPDSVNAEFLKDNVPDNIPTISLQDNDFSDAGSQNISSQLTAGRDPFYNAARFNFSAARFRLRGYDADFSSVYINGIPMDNLDNGFTPSALWGGLNDVFRNRDDNFGARYNTFGFGDISTTTNIDVRASKQRQQTSIGYALSNGNYAHHFSVTHSTGLSKNGWAFTASGSYRYAGEGYVPGTYYNGASWFIAADKKIGQNQLLSFIAFGAPAENGKQAAATQEMINLAGTHYYNPSWGYQNGSKRNANVAKNNQPFFIVTHEYRISNSTSLVSSASYSFGENSVSGIDWYNVPDPRPDYYRYLPSYYEASDNPAMAQSVKDVLSNSEAARQINWDNLYNVNRDNISTINNANGVAGSAVSGNRSFYILGERVTNVKRFAANVVLNSRLSNHINLTGGISFQFTRNNYFQRAEDLLGGQFWVNLNSFAQRDFPDNNAAYQNDLNHPNRIVYKGGKYGYDYNININKPQEWIQLVFTFKKFDFYGAAEVSQTKFWRVGNVRNGLFPDDSYGKSVVNIFDNFSAKGGITYKLNGRNYFYVNGAVTSRAPYFNDAYVSPRTRDDVQNNLGNQTIQTVEGGYVLNAPKIKLHASGYYTSMQHGFNVMTFYYDQYQDFVNYALSNINRLYFGGEFGAEVAATRNVTVNAAASVGRYYYNSRQHAVVTVDNTAEAITEATIYSKNFRIAGTPQEAYSLGVTYRSPKLWFASITGNYFDQMWLDINPLRRTYDATDNANNLNDEKTHAIIDQTRLQAQFTLDFFTGYSWKIPHSYNRRSKRPMYLAMSAGLHNLTNNKEIKSGYEQLRYDFSTPATDNLLKFPPKYYYSYGFNYLISLQLRF